ncbi:hypothetical protein NDU88_010809 [Scomber scombrus]|uniref:Recombination activating protein 1 n=1 Tax=Scomber scombrus TaxID=13677 RepID=A0AAV1NQ78_SCOSC
MPKRKTSFNSEWIKEHEFITKSSRDSFHGFCTLCRCDVDVYHAVKHHQSYRSLDCGMKVDREIFSDSPTAKGMACGRTKAKALCKNVIAPYSVQEQQLLILSCYRG